MNLLPALRNRRRPFSRTVFWRYKRGEVVRKAVRDGDMKYILENGRAELYDLPADEHEDSNLVEHSPAVTKRLAAKLAAWEKDVMAPRLRPFRTEPG